MADQNTEVEVKARALGWAPQEEFRGDPAKWVSAESYVQRGEEMMPLLRANNRKLQEELARVNGELARVHGVVEASQEAIEELKTYQTEETTRKVEKARRDLLADLKLAKKEGDTDREVDLQSELSQLDTAIAKAEKVPAKKEEPKTPPVHLQPVADPAFQAWQRENPWFGQDKKKTALMVAAAEEIRDNPANGALVGPAFYAAAAAEVDKVFGGPPSRTGSKVEGAIGSSGGSSNSQGRSFSDLPSDAKEACERQGKKLVGEGRAFKTSADWQKHYVSQYFLGE